MRKRIFLHVGANKTGSTAIQAFLGANQAVLRKRGIVLPDERLGFAGPASGMHVRGFFDAIKGPAPAREIRVAFEGMTARLAPGQSLLLSAENLSQLGRAAHLADVCRDHDVHVILYIRRQDELIASSWQQFGSHSSSDFNGWLAQIIHRIGDWERIIDSWTQAGAVKVDAAVYDRALFTKGDIRFDFLERLGLGSAVEDFRFDAIEANPSYSDVVTDLVAGNRRLFPTRYDLSFQMMLEDLGVGGESGPRKVSIMSRTQRESIIAHFEEKNRRVRERFFPGRERLFAEVDHDRYEHPTREEMTRRQLNFVLETVVALYEKTHPKREARWRRFLRGF